MAAAASLDPKTRRAAEVRATGRSHSRSAGAGIGPAARTFDLPYTDWGLKQWKDYDPVGKGDYAGNCLPFGMSRNINSPHGVQVLQHPDALAFLVRAEHLAHLGADDGQFKWPADLPETWNGTSVGRWDGDTLVVETTGFNGYTKLDTAGHPHSKQLKLTNTFLRTDSQHDAAHRDGARPEGLHARLDERADLADEGGAGCADGILVRGEQPPQSHRGLDQGVDSRTRI